MDRKERKRQYEKEQRKLRRAAMGDSDWRLGQNCPGYMPTEEEIRIAAAEIRSQRAPLPEPDRTLYVPHVYSLADALAAAGER